MPPKKKKVGDGEGRGEIQRQKSPAEFFADNQAIAGFDNYGKSLYTSIRELVENSLVSVFKVPCFRSCALFLSELTLFETSHTVTLMCIMFIVVIIKNTTPLRRQKRTNPCSSFPHYFFLLGCL